MKIISNLIEAHIYRIHKSKIEFLILKRTPQEIFPNIWQMVTGSINKGETAVEAVRRELKEETNLSPEKIWVVPNVNSFFNPNKNYICLIPVFLILANEFSDVRISDEHSEFKWVNFQEAKKLMAWQGQKLSLEIIMNHLIKKDKHLKFIEVKE